MSAGTMKLILRRGDTTLASLEMTPGCEAVLVGRSHDCAMRVPSDEHSVSGKHARLFWKGKRLYIEDASSRNGIFHDGVQVVKPTRITYGDYFALGNCQLAVGPKEKSKNQVFSKYHRLEFLNGDSLGKTVDINPKPGAESFSIGLDPGCDINLPDMLVSRKHAYISTKENGECWIEDPGSRNGTYVNGEKLEGKPRLLKHGDKISIAYFDFRFLDRSFRVTRVHVWKRLAAVAVTVCAVAAAYVLWMLPRPEPEDYINAVYQNAAAEDFVAARDALKMAYNARNASAYKSVLDALSSRLDMWERTRDDWVQVRKDIAADNLDVAKETMDRLCANPLEAWSWQPESMAATQREVEFVARAIRIYFDGREAIESAGVGSRVKAEYEVRTATEPVEAFLREYSKVSASHEYIKPIEVKLKSLLKELADIKRGLDVVDRSIANISLENPDFKTALSEISVVADSDRLPPTVREYARRQIGPCQTFLKACEFLDSEVERLVDLDFDAVARMSKSLALPDPEICTHQSKYSDIRAILLARHEKLQQESSAIRMIVDGLRASGVTPDGKGEEIEVFISRKNWEKALSFDCMRKAPPSARRTEPTSTYDEMLGIEFTYESLRAMPDVYNGSGMRVIGFTPKCVGVRKAFEKSETFVQYMDAPERKYLQTGALGRFYTICVEIAISREELVTMLKDVKGSKRKILVAAFYAEYFTPRQNYAAKRAIASQYSALKREVAELGDRYAAESDPEKQIQLRNQIVEIGIPGDPVLHTKWVQLFNWAN